MKKTNTRLIFAFLLVLVLAALMAVAAFAATPGTGYCVNSENKQTNIKWTMEENGVLTFEIDAAATDKVQTTALYGKDPVTGSTNGWDKCLPTFAEAVKIVIGDGITNVAGFSALPKLQQVELAASVTKLVGATFECSRALQSVYIRGTEPTTGLFDFSNIVSFGGYCCDGVQLMTKVVLNANLAGELPIEVLKGTKLSEIEIPAGVTLIKNNAFMQTHSLKIVTVLGMETTFESDDVFKNNNTYPAIKAKAGSKAAEFAKANGYTFIDLDTGEETKGTKLTTGDSTGGNQGGTSGGTTTPSGNLPEFKHDGATLWGHSSGKYNGGDIINTYWAYYDDTKTLEFVSATTKYNETGALSHVDKEYTNWGEYKDQIEHIIVGDYIVKISGSAFQNYTSLIDVKIGKSVNQIDGNAFTGCTSLTTIWRDGTERIEGRADLRGLQKVNNIISGTNVNEVILPNNTKELSVDLPPSVKTIWNNNLTPELIEYAKTNLFNLQNINNPEEIHEFWIYVDPTLPACGGRSVFSFDEATGTMTIHGAGAIDDIVNYYGGGSKKQPWFSIRQNVKHIVLSDNITTIGKYAFCEFTNLETVQIPAGDIEILNAAFEKCHNLKSIYRAGTEPIEGTADLRNVHALNSWTFAYDWLIANIIVSPQVEKIGSSVFEENINLANIYGTPGSFAETYATENGKTFFDVSANTPQPITCTPPETTAAETETEEPETTLAPDTTAAPDTETETETADTTAAPETMPIFVDEGDASASSSSNMLPIIIAVVAVVVVAAVVVVVIIVAKKKKAAK
ncbi:MAG: leucine-rich repeat protein [Clostridia bacterium]|nr:leucine-rich repeat protein [Clostridia bacterium]